MEMHNQHFMLLRRSRALPRASVWIAIQLFLNNPGLTAALLSSPKTQKVMKS